MDILSGRTPRWRVLAAFVFPFGLMAAGTTGNIGGSVIDPSGRVVPNTAIEVRHEGTGAAWWALAALATPPGA